MKIKLPLLKNKHFLAKKEYNCLSFHARIKTKTVLETLKDFLQKLRFTFSIFFFVFYSLETLGG